MSGGRGIAWALAGALVLGSVPVASVAAAPGRRADPLAEAKRLHEEGQNRFDTADYQGAVEQWTKAYGALPQTPAGASMKPFVLYNIATARERAFQIYGDVSQLKQARELLLKFEAAIDDTFDDPDEAATERERVRERIASLEALIDEHERGTEAAATTDDGTDAGTDDETDAGTDDEEDTAEAQPPPPTLPPDDPNVETDEPPRRSDPRLVAGAVLLGLGAGTGAMLVGGVVIGTRANDLSGVMDDDLQTRDDQFARGRLGNGLAIAGAVATPLLLGAGVALVVVAKRKPRGERVTLVPSAGGVALRF